MFELYDIKTNELIMRGASRAIAKYLSCAPSTVTGACAKKYALRNKYIVKSNGVCQHTIVNLYDVYDLEQDNKKIFESKRAKEIANELHFSLPYIYACEENKKTFNGRYLMVKVKDRMELRNGINS